MLGPDSYADPGFDDQKFKNLHLKVETGIVDPDFLLSSGSVFVRTKITHKNRNVKKFHVVKSWMLSIEG
jgi:hypothetical protein